MKFLLIFILLLSGCVPTAQEIEADRDKENPVLGPVLLFVDENGVKMYRYKDRNTYHYYAVYNGTLTIEK